MSNLIGFDKPIIADPRLLKAERPELVSVRVELRLSKALALKMFPTLIFGEDEKEAIVTEVLRPAAANEPWVIEHKGAGVRLCVDHYELDGVTL